MDGKNNSMKTAVRILAVTGVLLPLHEASAHHLTGGHVPANFYQGFISGLAHPVIGLDHLAFVVAAGLLSLRFSRGILIPLVFLLMGLVGTGLHIRLVNLPAPEVLVSSSIILFGLLLALPSRFPLFGIVFLAGLAGIAHGYAYGETIVGAKMTPLAAYLIGFTLIQFAVAMLARYVGRMIFAPKVAHGVMAQRIAGLGLSSVGLVFLIYAVHI